MKVGLKKLVKKFKVTYIFKKPNLDQKVCDLNHDLGGIFEGHPFFTFGRDQADDFDFRPLSFFS